MSADLKPMLVLVCEMCRGDRDNEDGSDCVSPECVGWRYANVCDITASHPALDNIISAARELDALFGGPGPGDWTLDGRRLDDGEATSALLSLHDHLNDLERAVRS